MSFSADRLVPSLSPFCHHLVDTQYLSLPEMQQALTVSQHQGRSLLEVIESLTGQSLSPEHLYRYKQQMLWEHKIIYGVEFVDIEQVPYDVTAIAELLDRYVPQEFCLENQVMPWRLQPPVELEGSYLEVLMVRPDDPQFKSELTKYLQRYSLKLVRKGIVYSDYEVLCQKYLEHRQELSRLHQRLEGPESPSILPGESEQSRSAREATRVDITAIMEETPPHINALTGPAEAEFPREESEESSVVALANKILILGLRHGVSEIYLDPQEQKMTVQMCQEGQLLPLMEPLPRKLAAPLVRRLKVMANLDPNKIQAPQKAKLRKVYEGRAVYFFIHTLPTFYGEKVMVRLVKSVPNLPSFADLGIQAEIQNQLKQLGRGSSGLVLVSGTQYGGLPQTIEAFLAQQLKRKLKVGTVEDPIRRSFGEITQLEVNWERHMTYPVAIKSLVEQGLGVIAVDQVEEPETAQAILEAVQQGCLVFAGIHAQDGARAIAKFRQWVEPAELAECLLGVTSQRSLRQVCERCRIPHTPTVEELRQLGLDEQTFAGNAFYRANSLNPELVSQLRLKGRLCPQCHGLGYHGQLLLYEIIPLSASLRHHLKNLADADQLRQAIATEGNFSLLQLTLEEVLKGSTSLEELIRIFPDALVRLSAPAPSLLPADFHQRLATLEAILNQLHTSLQALKDCIAPSLPPVPVISKPPVRPRVDDLDLTPELLALENLASQRQYRQEDADIDPSEATWVGTGAEWQQSPSASLEEDAKEATLVAHPLAEPATDQNATEIHPFKSIVDPW